MLQKRQPTLKEVQRLFEEWRRNKKGRERIPPALWEAAASQSGQYSVNEISKRLHLNHTAVRNRIEAYRQGEGIKPKEPAFIELDMISPRVITECIIEMEKPEGARMKIIIKGSCPDIAGVSKAFLG
jgi:hypothetical protein